MFFGLNFDLISLASHIVLSTQPLQDPLEVVIREIVPVLTSLLELCLEDCLFLNLGATAQHFYCAPVDATSIASESLPVCAEDSIFSNVVYHIILKDINGASHRCGVIPIIGIQDLIRARKQFVVYLLDDL